ncbi:winged helix-turn-helix domain-containing protein [Enterobacter sp. UPMP2060]
MLYIISGEIHFQNSDGAIWKEAHTQEESVTLTATTSRLLSYLLDHHGKVCTRDEILDAVWSTYGLRSSNNSLNKYIADLRRVFNNFELTGDVIITVPKVGFMFAKEVDVKKLQHSFNDENYIPDTTVVSLTTGAHDQEIQLKSHLNLTVLFFAIIFFGLSPIVFSMFIQNLKLLDVHSIKQSNPYLLENMNNCKIYTLQQTSTDITAIQLTIVKKLMQKTGFKCQENTSIFFQPSDPVIYGYPGRVFLSRCTYNNDKQAKLAACDNYYGVNYTSEE